MNFKALKLSILLLSLAIPKSDSAAQDYECVTSPSTQITKLRAPIFKGSRNAWDVMYAGDGMDVFTDLIPLDEKTFVAAGYYTKNKDDKIRRPMIIKYDDLFKPVWESREEAKDSRTISHILKTKDGFMVLGDVTNDQKKNGIYTSHYTKDGKPKSKTTPIFEAGGTLSAKAFIKAQDGGGYIVLAQYVDDDDDEKQYGILYKISEAGNIVWRRSYQTGQSNILNKIQATLDGTYVAVGQIVSGKEKSAGWVLRLDQKGAIQWQQTYPRGMAASFQTVAQSKEGDFILAGKSRPFDSNNETLAALVMKTDSNGKSQWERYFRGDYSYGAPDMIVYEDGRIVTLLTATSMGTKGHRSHARIMTFTAQGTVDALEDFVEGQNAMPLKLVSGESGERIIVGYAQTSFGEDQVGNAPKDAPSYTYDGWILAAPALRPYQDPCISPAAMSPLLP